MIALLKLMLHALRPSLRFYLHVGFVMYCNKQALWTKQASIGSTSSPGFLLQGARQFLWEMPEPKLDKSEAATRLATCATKRVL